MKLAKFILISALAVLSLTATTVFSVFAVDEDSSVLDESSVADSVEDESSDEDSPDSESQAETLTTTTTTMVTTTAPPTTTLTTTTTPAPVTQNSVYYSANIECKGTVDNSRVTVKLRIESDSLIGGATIHLDYDAEVLKFQSSSVSSEIGGSSSEKTSDGRYTFTYSNGQGTSFDGIFTTVVFDVLNKKASQTAVVATVDSINDSAKNIITNITITNAIIDIGVDDNSVEDSSDSESTDDSSEDSSDSSVEDSSEISGLTSAEDTSSEAEKSGSSWGIVLIVAIVIIGVGALAAEYYFLVYKKKKKKQLASDGEYTDDEYDDSEYDDDDYDDEYDDDYDDNFDDVKINDFQNFNADEPDSSDLDDLRFDNNDNGDNGNTTEYLKDINNK